MGRDATPSAPGLVELLHADAQRVIVRISAGQGLALQSALGEGSTAEIAEDRARQRLAQGSAQPPVQTLASAPAPAPEAAPALRLRQCQQALSRRSRPSLSSNCSPLLNHCRLHQRQQHRLQWQLSCR